MIERLLFLFVTIFVIFGVCPFLGHYTLKILGLIFPGISASIYWINVIVGLIEIIILTKG